MNLDHKIASSERKDAVHAQLRGNLMPSNSEPHSMQYTDSKGDLEPRPGLRAESLSSLEPPSKQSFRGSQQSFPQTHSMLNMRAPESYVNTIETSSMDAFKKSGTQKSFHPQAVDHPVR